MIQNSLKKATGATKSTGEFEYLANGEQVKLSSTMVKKYLVNGDADRVTDQEVMMYMTLCKYQHLNPFLREAYLVKYGNSPATIVTGKDTFTKRANKNPNYLGKQAGIIVLNPETGEIEQREGTFKLPNEEIVGGWARVFVKDREPEYNAVSFDEYVGRKSDGTLNKQWASKPATMIRKVAVVQALRECFPEDFGEMYSPEEMSNANNEIDVNEVVEENNTPIIPEETAQAMQSAPVTQPTQAENVEKSASDALFG